MYVTVTMQRERHDMCLDDGATGADLLARLDLTPEQAILVVDGGPVPHTERLPDGAMVKVVRVASGG
jgi:sulfur carrier protein ThiS